MFPINKSEKPSSNIDDSMIITPPMIPLILIERHCVLNEYNEIHIRTIVIGRIIWLRNVRLTPILLLILPKALAPTLYQAPPDQITDQKYILLKFKMLSLLA